MELRNFTQGLCGQLSPGEKKKGTHKTSVKPAPDSLMLRYTTNVPSNGLQMRIEYTVSVSKECCCEMAADIGYLWGDRADLHASVLSCLMFRIADEPAVRRGSPGNQQGGTDA